MKSQRPRSNFQACECTSHVFANPGFVGIVWPKMQQNVATWDQTKWNVACAAVAGHFNTLSSQTLMIWISETAELDAFSETSLDWMCSGFESDEYFMNALQRENVNIFPPLSGRCAPQPGMRDMRRTTSCSSKYKFSRCAGSTLLVLLHRLCLFK